MILRSWTLTYSLGGRFAHVFHPACSQAALNHGCPLVALNDRVGGLVLARIWHGDARLSTTNYWQAGQSECCTFGILMLRCQRPTAPARHDAPCRALGVPPA